MEIVFTIVQFHLTPTLLGSLLYITVQCAISPNCNKMQVYSSDTITQHATYNDRIHYIFSDRVAWKWKDTNTIMFFDPAVFIKQVIYLQDLQLFSKTTLSHLRHITYSRRTYSQQCCTSAIFHYHSAESSAMKHQTVSAKPPVPINRSISCMNATGCLCPDLFSLEENTLFMWQVEKKGTCVLQALTTDN